MLRGRKSRRWLTAIAGVVALTAVVAMLVPASGKKRSAQREWREQAPAAGGAGGAEVWRREPAPVTAAPPALVAEAPAAESEPTDADGANRWFGGFDPSNSGLQSSSGQDPASAAAPAIKPGAPGGTGGALRSAAPRARAEVRDLPEAAVHVLPGELNFRSDGELWIIERWSAQEPPREDDAPGCGAMITRYEDREVPLPLKHTRVNAEIHGPVAGVSVEQRFENPFGVKIEAVYAFPLPENAAVNEFVMTIDNRKIRGIIREREEAQRIYNEAKRQGYRAALLRQDRPNIFVQSVANIEPQRAIDVQIKYYNTLPYTDGAFEFTFPMTIGPRFNPPGSSDGVAALARGDDPRANQQPTDVSYLRPGERSGHDIDVTLEIDAGVTIESIASATHAVDVQRRGAARARVELNRFDRIPNRDLVVRIDVAGSEVKSGIFTHEDERGKFFLAMLVPPRQLERLQRGPIELVLVIDRSGSMSGQPLAQAKAAAERALQRLRPGDTFQVIDFSESTSQLGSGRMAVSPGNLQRARKYLASLESGGGTMMTQGMAAALDLPADPYRPRYVAFLTDGFIGNENEVLGVLAAKLNGARVFSFGVGSSPNTFLMDRMSVLGRGVTARVGLNDDAATVMDLFIERIERPALADIQLEFTGTSTPELYPARIPDLFVGRPVIVMGRYAGNLGTARVIGRTGSGDADLERGAERGWRQLDMTLPLSPERAERAVRGALPFLWARAKLSELGDRQIYAGGQESAIRATALTYGLMSRYTSFLAVDASAPTPGSHGVTVQQSLPMPEGVRYETTVPSP